MENLVNNYLQLKKIYHGKRIFVTGHTGFKGSWLINILHLLGAEICGYSLPPISDADLFYLTSCEKKCKSIYKDIREKEAMINALVEFNPDFIFHLAAQPLVRESYLYPDDTFSTNFMGTCYLLEGIRKLKNACCIVLITTDKVYKNNDMGIPYKEIDELGGYDPYSASKASVEILINSYYQSYFNLKDFNIHKKSIAVARAGNVIGGGDWSSDRLIPDIVKSISSNTSILVRNPYSTRPWQHVLDPLFGYLLLGMYLSKDPHIYSGAYNFGPASFSSMDVISIVQMSIIMFGKGSYQIVHSENSLHEAKNLYLDIEKASAILNWAPVYNTAESIKLTIDWYKQYFSNPDTISDYTFNQINEFFQIIS